MSSTPPPHPLGQFLSRAAHDMKQPLNVLQMYLGILQEQAGITKGDELTQVVDDSLHALQSMLNLLSNWARADGKSLKIQPERVTAAKWFQHLGTMEWISPPHPVPTYSEEDEQRLVDLTLLTRTLHDILALLPKGTTIATTATPWRVEIRIAPPLQTGKSGEILFGDALHQLAIEGGGTILDALGFQQQPVERDGTLVVAFEGEKSTVTEP